MSNDKFLKDQMKQLKTQSEGLGQSFGSSVDAVHGKIKEMLTDEQYAQWKDLNGRLLTARLNGDTEQVKSIENDLREIFDN